MRRLGVEPLEDRVVPSADWAEPNNTQGTATYLGRSGILNWSGLSIDTPADVDWLAFRLDTSGIRGQYAGINLAQGAGDLNVELYNASGTLLTGSYGLGTTEQINLDRRAAGIYYLKVVGNAGATGGYTFFSNGPALSGGDFAEANDASASAFVIPSIVGGFSISALSLHSPTDQDWYRIQLLATGDATSQVQANFSNADGNVDLELYRADGTTLVASSTGSDDAETISLTGLASGTYYARVFGAAGATNPSYSLTASGPHLAANDRFEPNNSTRIPTALGTLSYPQTYADLSINTTTDLDYYKFTSPIAGRATVRIDFSHALGDLQLVLSALNGTVLGTSVGTTDTERIDFTAAANATYVLKVYGQSGATGGYSLQVIPPVPVAADALEPNNSVAAATDLGVVAGTLTRTGLSVHTGTDADWFRFTLPWAGGNGNYARIDFSQAAGDLDLALYGPDGTTLLASSTGNSDGEQVSLAGLAAGTYYLKVNGFGGATNPVYALTVNGPTGPAPDALEPNDTAAAANDLGAVAGSLTRTGLSVHSGTDVDWFQFTTAWPGQFGNTARINSSNISGDLDLQLVGPDGTVLATASGPNDVEELSLAGLAPGTYFLRVYGAGGAINPSYSLTVVGPVGPAPDARESNNSAATASNIGRVSGPVPIVYPDLSIHSSRDVDWFRFETVAAGAAGHYATIDFQNRLGDLELALYGPDGTTLIASSTGTTDYEKVSLAGLAAGVYYLKVYGTRSVINPAYTLTILAPAVPSLPPDRLESNDDTGAATVLRGSTGTTLTGTRDEAGLSITPGDIDVFQFTTERIGSAANFVSISFLNGDGNLSLDLLAADGTVLDTSASDSADGELISLAGRPAGTYYARVSGAAPTTVNTYALRVKAPDAPDAWTLMVYITAGTLERQAFADINEMEAAAASLPGSVNITVFWDQSAAGKTYPTGYGRTVQPAWGTAGRAVVVGDTDPSRVRTEFEILPEQDSGDPATLQSFIQWSAQNAPARHYALVLWDHGNGINGFNFDNHDGLLRADNLTTPELVTAISNSGVPIDVLGFDSCLMAMDEVAYSLRNSATVFVASEEAQDASGNDYRTLLDVLKTPDPYQVDAESLAAGFVYSYGHRSVGSSGATPQPGTYSAVRSSEADDLAAALSNFVSIVGNNPSPTVLNALRRAQNAATSYFRPDFRDLGSFMSNVTINVSRLSSVIRNAAAAVNTALTAAVVSKTQDSRMSSGLSLYMPGAGKVVAADYASTYAAFNQATHWDSFLQVLTTGWAPDPRDSGTDWAEENDTWARPYRINFLSGPENVLPGLNLDQSSDEDWFSVTILSAGETGNQVSVIPDDAGAQIEVELYSGTYAGSGRPLVGDNGTHSVSLAGRAAGTYLVRVRTTGDDPVLGYKLVIDAPNTRPEGDRFGDNSSNDKSYPLDIVGPTLVSGPQVIAGIDDFFTLNLPVSSGATLYQIQLTTQIAASLTVEITGLPGGTQRAVLSSGQAVLQFQLPDNAPQLGMRVIAATDARYSLLFGVAPNTPPTISDVADLTIARDADTGPLPFSVSDGQTAAADLSVTFESSNTALVPTGNIVPGGSGESRTVTVTPATGQSGTATITMTVRDADGLAASSTFTVRVNAPPTATADAPTVGEDSGATVVNVLANDLFAPDVGERLSVTGVTQGAHGTVTLASGVVRYAPAPNYNGPDSFTYTLSDGNGGTATGTVNVVVTPVNDPPTATPDALSVAEDSGATAVDVLANDSPAPDVGEVLAVVAVGQPAHGVVTLVGGVVLYAPAANYIGPDSFTYTIGDGSGSTATATVSVLVGTTNDPPTALTDTLSVSEDSAATVVDVLANDSSAPDIGEVLGVVAVGQPAHGVVTLVGGVVRYAPDANYSGPDSFTYTIGDGNGGTATGTVNVVVTPVNDQPTAAPDALSVAEDSGTTAVAVLGNDSFAPDATETLSVVSVTQPSHGTVTLVGGVVRYAPVADYNGPDSFAYTVSDGNGGTAVGTVTVVVTPVNDPPTAAPDALSVAEDSGATAVAVLGNDSFAPDAAETLSVVSVAQPAHGVVTLVGGVVRYTPAADYNGPDSFVYTVSDGNGGTAVGTVSVVVTPVNDPPTAAPDALSVAEDSGATAVAVLGNDSFAPDATETLSVVSVAQPAHGIVTLVGGVVRYTPAADYNGPDSFAYTLIDGNGGAATGTVTVVVTPVNDNPTADTDTLTVAEDGGATAVDVLANDLFAPDVGEILSVAGVTQGTHGTVTLVGGVVRYAPAADYNGPDTFAYTVSDGNSGTATGTVTVVVTPVNDPPTAAPDAFGVGPGTSTLPVLGNDTPAPDAGESLAVVAVTQPAAGGTAAVAPGGSGVVFTPAAGFAGTATFTYSVGDGTPGSIATAAVTVTVTVLAGSGPVRPVAVGGAADGSVRLVTAAGTSMTLSPFGSTGTPTRTATGDIDGDGVADVIAVTGPGTALRVAVLSGADGHVVVAPFDPFGGNFPGGGYVAAADMDGDGNAEFAVTPDQGGGPRVTVYSRNTDGTIARRANFFGIDDANFRGGARAALGDVNADGVPDVVVAAGFGGGPRTAIFTGQSVLAGSPVRLVADFFAFPGADALNLRNGSFVAAGDITGDGFADLAFGGGPGGAPRVFILSGALVSAGNVAGAQAAPVANFFVGGDLADRGGARVAVTNADGDGKMDVAVGSGAGRPARVRLYLGKDFTTGGEPAFTDFDPLGGAVLADGVYVG